MMIQIYLGGKPNNNYVDITLSTTVCAFFFISAHIFNFQFARCDYSISNISKIGTVKS